MADQLATLNLPVETAATGEQAAIAANKGELALLAVWANLPDMSVEKLIRQLRWGGPTRRLPMIVCCPSGTLDRREAFLEAGATDCLTAPAESFEVMARARNALRIGALEAGLLHDFTPVQKADTPPELDTFDQFAGQTSGDDAFGAESLDMILTLANAAEHKQGIDSGHHRRIVEFTTVLCRGLGWFDDETSRLVSVASALHDVGKAGLTDMVLMKPGLLTNEEFEEMKRHTTIGAEILSQRPGRMAAFAAEIARSHHERWDGRGYPDELDGEAIPKAARVVALSDAFDALQTHRIYRPEYPIDQCYEMIKSQSGKQFDPEVVDIFTVCRRDIEEILLAHSVQ